MLTGSCLCGGVRYQIDGELGAVTQLSLQPLPQDVGIGFFGSGSTIPTASFRFVAGEDLLKEWESSHGLSSRVLRALRVTDSKEKDKDAETSSLPVRELWTSDPG